MKQPTPITKYKVSLVMLFEDAATGQTLVPILHRKGKGSHSHDTWWELPGGKRDMTFGGLEAVEQAAIREAREELGIIILPNEFGDYPIKQFDQTIVLPKTKHTEGSFVQVVCPDGQIPYNAEPREHDRMILVSASKAAEMTTHRITAEVRAYLHSLGSDIPSIYKPPMPF